MTDLTLERLSNNRSITEKLFEKLYKGEIKFDWNGHQRRRVTQPTVPEDYVYEYRRDFPYEEVLTDDLRFVYNIDLSPIKDILNGKSTKWAEVYPKGYKLRCYDCGKKLAVEFNGSVLRAKGKCPYPDGHPPFEAELDIPSGVIAFANVFDCIKQAKIKETCGVAWDLSLWKANHKLGIFCGFCGNTCPSIKQKDNDIIICSQEYKQKGFEDIGGVTTDIWHWQATDLDFLKKKLTSKKIKFVPDDYTLAKVKPGRYKATDFFHLVDRTTSETESQKPFATIERI